ncbi:mechanosensitive ion channel-like protein [Hydrogenivirga caldilitoris]|uniref:Mechanosensitive ion channel-like protein n=1 Tax=Hydrogenivirga caldilitoris TaxID=246264 RepID=A0A497XWW0_9AQUI|nr:mechanosensitive ion channel domain-containing protein [Hydrogenivirga caldilitoris]RLJ71253.1 mechanosensitive ion channel-like protein [Hydrogenivirga caldilitoris]
MDGDTLQKVFLSALVLFASFILASLVKGRVYSLKERFGSEKLSVLSLISNFLYVTVVSIGLITSLGMLGVNVSALIAGLGLTGFALGFALKDIISNLLSGILIILYNPFKIGDVIKVGGYEGKVVEVNFRYTVIEREGEVILIPNSTMFTNIIAVKKE